MEHIEAEEKKIDLKTVNLEEAFRRFSGIGVMVVLDHGRAGNNFFMRIFDQHSEVLSVPFIGYFYSSLLDFFAGRTTVPGAEAYQWMLRDNNISHITYKKGLRGFERRGDDPNCNINHATIRHMLTKLLIKKPRLTHKEIIGAVYLSYALGMGRNINQVKYLLVNDSTWDADGRENKVLFDAICADNPKIIHLVRNPRASFASLRHEYVNEYGNMYPLRPPIAMWKVTGCNSVWLWILRYTTKGAKALFKLGDVLGKDSFYTLRYEDLNLRFVKTMRHLIHWLGVCWYEPWSNLDYVPTAGGLPSKGTSAYRSTRRVHMGPLKDDLEVSFPGPNRETNREVTERWKKRLYKREIKMLEAVYYDEMREFDYESMYVRKRNQIFPALMWVLFPLAGEIPRFQWWVSTKRIKNKIAFLVISLPVYILSRIIFFISYFKGEFSMVEGENE